MRDACETCGGDGYLTEDYADRRGEHQTREVACPDCADDCDPPEPIEVEDPDLGAEVRTEVTT